MISEHQSFILVASAAIGVRFHGMEEVKGSNPFRSTKTLSNT